MYADAEIKLKLKLNFHLWALFEISTEIPLNQFHFQCKHAQANADNWIREINYEQELHNLRKFMDQPTVRKIGKLLIWMVKNQKCCSYVHLLNCFAIEWNRTNWSNCCVTLKGLSFVRALVLSVPKPHLISSVVAIKTKDGAKTMMKMQKVVAITLTATMNCKATANEYPNGFFTSNGNLKKMFVLKLILRA